MSKSIAAYEALRKLVIEGSIRPRERLIPAQLAALLKISATPIREALARLAAEGYISWTAHLGYFTKLHTIDEQRNLYNLLLILQRASLESASGALSEEGLLQFHEPVTDAASHVGFVEQLHDRIAALCNNSDLHSLVNVLISRTHPVRTIAFESSVLVQELRADLIDLLDALRTRDTALAVVKLQSMFKKKIDKLEELVAEANLRARRARIP